MTRMSRPFLAGLTAISAALLMAGCSSGPLSGLFGNKPTPQATARYFQYTSPDNQVMAEYATPDAATCQRHLANLRNHNAHGGPEATRCHGSSAAGNLPVAAAARDASGTEYAFRFANLEQCRRMMPAVATGATVTRNCQ